jgi:hypothetical protein
MGLNFSACFLGRSRFSFDFLPLSLLFFSFLVGILSHMLNTDMYYVQAELKEFEALLWELHDSLKVKREASRSALLADLALSSPELVDALYASGTSHVHEHACTFIRK